MQEELNRGLDKERLDQFSRFLLPTLPKGYQEYYNERKQLIGKELSVANLEREDQDFFYKAEDVAMEMLIYGQDGLAREIMIKMIFALKLSMSVEGKFVEQLLSNKIEYAQTQTVHEHVHTATKKKPLFGKPKGGA